MLVVGLVVAIGGVAFAVGRVTAPAASAAGANRQAGANGVFGNGAAGALPNGSFAPGADGFRGALGGLTGTVTAITADTLTIQVGGTSGRTIEIPLSSSTAYHTEQAATAADVKVGAEVTVRTQRNATATGGTSGQPNQQNGQQPQASGAPGQPGIGGPPGGFSIGTATDVTVVGTAAQ